MTTQLFTVYDTDYDLSLIDDCNQFIDTLEEFGKIRTWQLYDLICEVEDVEGSAEDYQQFLTDIHEKYGQLINVSREICGDDCLAKTILSQYSPKIDQYFRSNGAQPFITQEIEHFTLDIGTATEANYVPVQQVAVTQHEPLLVTRVLEPVRGADGFTRIGNIGEFSVMAFKLNVDGHSQWQYGFKHPQKNIDVPDEINNIAECMFREFLSEQEDA